MNEKIKTLIFYAALILIGAVSVILVLIPRPKLVEAVSEEDRLAAYLLLLEDLPVQSGDYYEYYRRGRAELTGSGVFAEDLVPIELVGDPLILSDESINLEFNVPESGLYVPVFDYRRIDEELNNFKFALELNGSLPFSEARSLELPRLWSDETKEFTRDRYNDESLPLQIPFDGWMSESPADTAGRVVDPVGLSLEAGFNRISLRAVSSAGIEIRSLTLRPYRPLPTYAEYRASLPTATAPAEVISIDINAIDYVSKNAYDVRLGAEDDPAAQPFDRVDALLNVIEGSSWEQSGEEISYEFSVPRSGRYLIGLHYKNPKADFSVFRSLRVNGEIPFAELRAYEFESTGINRWSWETLAGEDGDAFELYLQEGLNRISLRTEREPVTEATRALKMIIAHMNYFGIEIMKVAGREVDENRTWRLTNYIPKTAAYLDAYRLLISDIMNDLASFSTKGIESSMTASLETALFKLEKLAEDPDELPVYLSDIYSTSIYDKPISQILGDTVTMLEDGELTLEAIAVESEVLPRRANAGFLARSSSSLASLWSTFTSDKYITRNEDEVLNIWVTRPITHTDIMQKMADADFTRRTGIEVKISVMPDPNRLILATAADTVPDVAMGLPSYIPFDLAIRGASYDISQFPDFWEVASDFSPGAFIPYILNQEVYALPETLDFHSLIYRTDIFDQLDLVPPNTWAEVIDMLPVLQRYGMNFYHPIAGGLPTLKWFYQTSPFVYQFGGQLYEPDGLSVSLDDPDTVAGLRFMSELFSLYALQQQVPIFYNSFRFGVIPVGIVDSQSYLQIKFAAPELRGQWSLAPYPGIPDENGEVQRWFIANGVAALIMKDSDRPEQAWEFMKWWLSKETQVDFGYRLQSTYGPEFLWISANLDALADAPIDEAEKEVILEQVKWQRDVPRTPAQYMLERGLSDIWINSATQNMSVRTEIDKMIPVIDREVSRKMIEFGFIDPEGNVLKPFEVPSIEWVIEQMEPYRREDTNE
jgi:ABC-type glycerol-3-phosphate transport system substrate-binding protein